MRLDKFLASCNYGTRKEVNKIIKSKVVFVNEQLITDAGFNVKEDIDCVKVDNKIVQYIKNIYIMLNKPKNVLSATEDNFQTTVIDLMSEYRYLDIFPVGRLDIDTTGLLLITNDGQLAHNMLSPTKHVDKTYEVTLSHQLSEEDIKTLESGIELDGKITKPAKIDYIDNLIYHITIHEGMFHQVKRMFQFVNNEVVELKRISFGPLKLDENLKAGEYRLLTEEEKAMIKS